MNKKKIAIIIIVISVALITIMVLFMSRQLKEDNSSSSSEESSSSTSFSKPSSSVITGNIDDGNNDSGKDVPSLSEAIANAGGTKSDDLTADDGELVGGNDTVIDNVTDVPNSTSQQIDVVQIVTDKLISSDILPLPKSKKGSVKLVQTINLPVDITADGIENLPFNIDINNHTYFTKKIINTKGTKKAPSQKLIQIDIYK